MLQEPRQLARAPVDDPTLVHLARSAARRPRFQAHAIDAENADVRLGGPSPDRAAAEPRRSPNDVRVDVFCRIAQRLG
jgi:hypothetical protein